MPRSKRFIFISSKAFSIYPSSSSTNAENFPFGKHSESFLLGSNRIRSSLSLHLPAWFNVNQQNRQFNELNMPQTSRILNVKKSFMVGLKSWAVRSNERRGGNIAIYAGLVHKSSALNTRFSVLPFSKFSCRLLESFHSQKKMFVPCFRWKEKKS